jgi:hypothetical protein
VIEALESLPVDGAVVVRDAPARGGESRRVMTLGCGEILCARCAGRAEKALLEIRGVDGVRMLWERDRTEVIYRISGLTGISDPEQLDEEAVLALAGDLLEAVRTEVAACDHSGACGGSSAGRGLLV